MHIITVFCLHGKVARFAPCACTPVLTNHRLDDTLVFIKKLFQHITLTFLFVYGSLVSFRGIGYLWLAAPLHFQSLALLILIF